MSAFETIQPRTVVHILTWEDGSTMITDNMALALREERLTNATMHSAMMSRDQWKSLLTRFLEEVETYK